MSRASFVKLDPLVVITLLMNTGDVGMQFVDVNFESLARSPKQLPAYGSKSGKFVKTRRYKKSLATNAAHGEAEIQQLNEDAAEGAGLHELSQPGNGGSGEGIMQVEATGTMGDRSQLWWAPVRWERWRGGCRCGPTHF